MIAFPKTQRGQDLLMDAPGAGVGTSQLDDLSAPLACFPGRPIGVLRGRVEKRPAGADRAPSPVAAPRDWRRREGCLIPHSAMTSHNESPTPPSDRAEKISLRRAAQRWSRARRARSSPSSRGMEPVPTSGPPSVRVIDAAVARAYGGHQEDRLGRGAGGPEGLRCQTGEWLPDATVQAFRDYLVGIKGPLTTPVGRRHPQPERRPAPDPRSLRVPAAGASWYPGVPSPP